MFDLFRSREKSTRILLGTLLMLIAISMVVTLIPGVGTGDLGQSDQVVATIGDEEVSMREISMSLQETLKGRDIPPDLISIYAPQIVNQLITERAVAYYAKNVGYQTTDEDVAHVIRMQVPQLFENGKFIGKEAYAQFLASNNTTIAEYERRARMLAGLRRLQGMVLEGMVVTPQEIEAEYRARNDKVVLDYVKIDPNVIRNQIKVSQEEINAHWASSRAMYKIPEKRAFRMLVADEAKVGESIKMSDAQLLSFYNSNKDSFRTPERVRARHILIKTMDKPKEEHDKLKKKAEDLLKQVKAGADFAELAKKHSEDTVSAAKGGDLDWFGRGQMVPEFEKAAFALKPNEISDIVTSSFGYHIIQTTAKEEARLKPFEEVKEQIQKEQTKQQVYDRMQENIEQARRELLKNPAAAESLAAKYSLHFVKVERAARGEALPQVGQSVELDDAVFGLRKKGDVTDVVQVPGSKLVVAVLDDVIPERPAELSEVENQVRSAIQNERSQRIFQERSNQLMDEVRRNNGDLRKAAAALKLEVKTTNEFSRESNADGIGPGNNLEEAFRRDVGAVFGPVNLGGTNYICKVVKKVPADMANFEQQKFDILLRLKGRKAQERKDLFEDGLLQFLQKKGVVKINKDAVKRLVDTYKNS
ncbi:MAG: peptidylprolyl isomerase [Bryobacteraceae bacterium]|nr:peptidylprolyl isomerase [Bryobacteraceae bacterium]MDW8379622.1 peptidylprolyl isomerase [Bryobacterales bacterium]